MTCQGPYGKAHSASIALVNPRLFSREQSAATFSSPTCVYQLSPETKTLKEKKNNNNNNNNNNKSGDSKARRLERVCSMQ